MPGDVSLAARFVSGEALPTPGYHPDATLSLGVAAALLTGEQLVRGYDIARTVRGPWPIDPASARFVVRAATWMIPLAADPAALAPAGAHRSRRRGCPSRSVPSCVLGSVLLEEGDVDAAARYAREARGGMGVGNFESQLVLAEVALTRGDPDGPRLATEALSATEAVGYRSSPARRRLATKVPSTPPTTSRSRPAPRRREQRTFMFTDIVQSTTSSSS